MSQFERGDRTTIDTIVPGMLKAALNAFTYGSRSKGRTCNMLKTAMVDLAKNDELNVTFIFETHASMEHSRALWRNLNEPHVWPERRVQFATVKPATYALMESLSGWIRQPTLLYFDHSWLEQYYQTAIDGALSDLIGTAKAAQRGGL